MKEKSIIKNNIGATLIEIMVVVVIMGIIATAAIVNISAVYGRNASNAAKKLGHFLDGTRMEAMNRVDGKVYAEITIDGNDIIATKKYVDASGNVTSGDSEVLCNTGLTVKISYATVAGSPTPEPTVLTADNSIVLAFNKSTGAFTKNIPDGEGGTTTMLEGNAVSFNGSKSAELVLVWDTGRNYVD